MPRGFDLGEEVPGRGWVREQTQPCAYGAGSGSWLQGHGAAGELFRLLPPRCLLPGLGAGCAQRAARPPHRAGGRCWAMPGCAPGQRFSWCPAQHSRSRCGVDLAAGNVSRRWFLILFFIFFLFFFIKTTPSQLMLAQGGGAEGCRSPGPSQRRAFSRPAGLANSTRGCEEPSGFLLRHVAPPIYLFYLRCLPCVCSTIIKEQKQ